MSDGLANGPFGPRLASKVPGVGNGDECRGIYQGVGSKVASAKVGLVDGRGTNSPANVLLPGVAGGRVDFRHRVWQLSDSAAGNLLGDRGWRARAGRDGSEQPRGSHNGASAMGARRGPQ